jgi:hypothetical protein
MASTTNYSWTTPDDTALVKDGAAAIRTLGSSVDTTTKALNPSTTLGDIEYRSATANTNTRLGIGTAGQVLQVNSGATAPEWATPAAGGGMTLLSTTNLTTTTTAITGISQDYTNLMIVVAGISIPTAQRLEIEFRSATNARVVYAAGANQTSATTRNGVLTLDVWDANITATDTRNMCVAKIDNYADATRRKGFQIYGSTNDGGSYINLAGAIDNTAALNAFFVDCNAVPTAGTVQIWGIK